MTQIQLKPAPPVRGLPDSINEVLLRGLAKDPHRRQASCGELCRALLGAIHSAEYSESTVQTELFPPLDAALALSYDEATVALEKQDTATHRMRLGTLLIEDGLLRDDQLVQALEIQKVEQRRLGEILITRLGLTEAGIARALSRQIQIPFRAPLPPEEIERGVARMITAELARSRGCLPIGHEGDSVVVAMADPLDLQTLNELETTFGTTIHLVVTTASALDEAIDAIWPPATG